jgi:hypothetical protein
MAPRDKTRKDTGLVTRAGRGVGRLIFSVVVGAIAFFGAFFVLVWGEARVNIGTAIAGAVNLNEMSAAQGRAVTYTGALGFTRGADDGVLAGHFAYIRRTVETCAWTETDDKKKGIVYAKRWVEAVPDSSRFGTNGYDNRTGAVRSAEAFGGELKVGSFRVEGLGEVLNAEMIAPRVDQVAHVRSVDQHWAYLAADRDCAPAGAAIGDQRLRFEVLREGDLVTVFGRRNGRAIAPFRGQILITKGGGEQLAAGVETARTVETWLFRGAGGLLLWFALYALLSPVVTTIRWIPIVGDLAGGVATLAAMVGALGLTLGFVFLGWGMAFFSKLYGGLVG